MEKDELIKKIEMLESPAHHGQGSRARLDVILIGELNQSLTQLSSDIQQAKKILGMRISELNEEMQKTRNETSAQTSALVKWTRVLVWATITYTILTGVNILVSFIK